MTTTSGIRFSTAFPGVSIEATSGRTRLVTDLFDQGQLRSLLNRLDDFGLDLVSVEAIPS
jgi:hypothetical protein